MSATSDITVHSVEDDTITGIGQLTYNMNITAGAVGGNSEVTISPNNNIAGIGARYEIFHIEGQTVELSYQTRLRSMTLDQELKNFRV